MQEDKFLKLYSQLNPEQKLAVDTIEGPVMVVAGPGTGKTHVLTLRIANILRITDTEPENILALTFTDSAVVEMRKRLVEIIGSLAYRVQIFTFHSFCNRIIQEFPEYFPKIIGSIHIGEVEQIKIIAEILEARIFEYLKPFGNPLFYLKDILQAISELKRENITPDLLRQLAKEEEERFYKIKDLYHQKGPYKGRMKGKYLQELKFIKKNLELAEIYKLYQQRLAQEKFYDYTDMIMEVLNALEREKDLLLILQERYQYILVDEHQDTNKAQNKIVELLSSFHPNPNVFVVGDQKQAIFRFQGASLENFVYFKQRFPSAKLIELTQNYRSQQLILDSAQSLIKEELELKSQVNHPLEKIKLAVLSTPEAEMFFVAKKIKELKSKGVPLHEIAILYRDNADFKDIAYFLEKEEIPFVVESEQDILEDFDIQKLIKLLEAVANFTSPESLISALHLDFLKIDWVDVLKLLNFAKDQEKTLFEILEEQEKVKKLNLSSLEHILNFYHLFKEWVILSQNLSLPHLVERIALESGFLSYLLQKEDYLEKAERLKGFFKELENFTLRHKSDNLKDFLDYLQTMQEYRVSIKRSIAKRKENRVRLMTAHKAKGREFDYVFIIKAQDGKWGNRKVASRIKLPTKVYSLTGKDIEDQDPLEDERRLFYVALTRGRKEVFITLAKEDKNKKELLPSQFVKEIKEELIEPLEVSAYEEELEKKVLVPRLSSSKKIFKKEKEYIQERFLEQGLSAVSLNNYLECPWKYFYLSLIRIPKPKEPYQMYGTSIHDALRDLFNQMAKGKKVTKEFLLERFEFYLKNQALSLPDFERYLKRGIKNLSHYFEAKADNFYPKALAEVEIRGVLLDDKIRLKGRLDKVDILSENLEVRVIDFKTGKPKSRNELEGKTKNSSGNEKRQLVFYKVLLDLYKGGKYKMIKGRIEYVEPTENLEFKSFDFEINKEESEALKEQIRKVSEEILSFAFREQRCKNKDCQWCKLRDLVEKVN